jgi:Uma2 family endonuclease
MASLPSTKTVTYDEWLRMPEVSDEIEEVVNGEVRLMPPPKWKHSLIVQYIYDTLRAQLDPRHALVVASAFGLVISKQPLTTRVSDLAVFDLATIIEQDGYIHSAPQLIVEVLSPANRRREREEKLADYARLGVAEVWVVAPEGQTVEVLRLEEGRLRRSAIPAEGMLTPARFANVQIDIARIWPD